MSYYDSNKWTILQVAKAFKGEADGNDTQNIKRIVIPMFQRGLRWDAERRTRFIDSLIKGYPFGSLLLAQNKDDANAYSVVDGLQRGSTICDYVYNPLSKNNQTGLDDSIITKIRDILFPMSSDSSIDDNIRVIISDFLDEKKSYVNVQPYDIARKIVDTYDDTVVVDKYKAVNAINDLLSPIYNDKKSIYDMVCNAIVPLVIYSGPDEYLCEIFRRINVNGQQLSDYEIYAAIWSQTKKKIETNDIVQYVVNKYILLQRKGYYVEDFSSNDLLVSQELTAFEYLFGLSKYWIRNYNCLQFNKKAEADDYVNEMAFEIVDACISKGTKSISNLDTTLYRYDVNKLQNCIEEAIVFVSDSLKSIGKFKGNSRTSRNLYQKYLIISFIAYTFKKMYSVDDLDKKREDWEETAEAFRKNLLRHYIVDTLNDEWHDGGAGKVYTFITDKRYDDEISTDYIKKCFNNYFNQQLENNKQSSNFSGPKSPDLVILNCIYLSKFSADDQLSEDKKFDIEHLATKEKMASILANLNGIKLPVACIANLCYLPEKINRGKKDKTLYEVKNKLTIPISEIEDKYSFTKEKDFDWLAKEYTNDNISDLISNYSSFLQSRYAKMESALVTYLDGVSSSAEGEENTEEITKSEE